MTPRPAPPAMPPALARLAEAHGVLAAYTGTDGDERTADPESVVAVLGALGVEVAGPGAAAGALDELRRRPPEPLPPVTVLWAGRQRLVTVTLPPGSDPDGVRLSVTAEDGTTVGARLVDAGRPAPGPEGSRGSGGAMRWEVRPFDGPAVPGYHRLRLELGTATAESLMVVTPPCPRHQRGWGAFLALHALATEGDLGIGTYPALGSLRAWLGGAGASFLGTLPLFPAYLEGEGGDPSPYLPVTRLGWNEVYVDPRALPELADVPAARDVLAGAGVGRPGPGDLVDHAATMALVRAVLEPMAEHLFAAAGPRRAELEAFADERPHLRRYASFRAGAEHPAGTAEHERAERYHLYAQWAAATQLAEAAGDGPPGLYLDLPVGVHPAGFDPADQPHAFAAGVHGGAPPDDFFAAGQDWGFPPLHPDGDRRQGYRYLRAALGHAMAHAHLVRLDHVMGLHRLYWIPEGADARHGVYVRYPHEEVRAVVALEANRSGAAVVGEDLGTVDPAVRRAMADDGMLRSWVLQFESSAEEPLPDPPVECVASWGTHDLPRFAAFAGGDDLAGDGPGDPAAGRGRRAWRSALARALDVADDDLRPLLAGCLRHLAAGPARHVLVEMEDLWLERRPQNRPGTGPGANWRVRAPLTLAGMVADPLVADVLAAVDRARRADAPPVAAGAR